MSSTDTPQQKFDPLADRAGIVPWRRVGDELVFLTMIPSDPMYGGPNPQIAKGVIDPGETPMIAAYREGEEELGLTHKAVNMLSFIDLGTFRLTRLQYKVWVFAIELTNTAALVEPHYETSSVQWLSLGEFIRRGRADQHEIIKKANDRIYQLRFQR
jgi:8-oxo-dGTP pyrophosphatase MutT (NUDIX family)